MESTIDTADLVDQARQGSQSAFTELVRRFQGPVRGFLYRFVQHTETADDLAQEVFLAAYRRMEEFRGASPFGSWLLGIARNQALAFLRREGRRRRHQQKHFQAAMLQWQAEQLEKWPPSGKQGDSQDLMEEQDRRLAALRSCIEHLPPASRSVVRRYYFEGQSADSIAVSLSKQCGAVRMMLLRIRRGLRNCVTAKMQNEENSNG